MDTTKRQTVLITGASQGIGYELAKIFAAHGYELILGARNREKLKEVASEIEGKWHSSTHIIIQDLADGDAAQTLYDQIAKLGLQVDVLVNNAGFGDWGAFAKGDLEKMTSMLRLNIESLTVLTRLFLPDMLARKQGKIMNVASVAGFVPGPFMAVYYASKAYVLSFTEALAGELRGTGVTITALCPGATATGFQKAANIGEMSITSRLPDAAEVARQGYRALMSGKTIIIPGWFNKIMIFSTRFVPRSFIARVAAYLNTNA